jgi:hypothetical protein
MFVHEHQKKKKKKGKKGRSDDRQKSLYDLLSISLRYEFARVTAKVVACIDDYGDDTDPVTQICFGVVHDSLRRWVLPAYMALIERDHFLTEDEIVRLGAGRTAILGSMREQTRERNTMQRESQPFSLFSPVGTIPISQKEVVEVPAQFYCVGK